MHNPNYDTEDKPAIIKEKKEYKENLVNTTKIKFKVRFDYKGTPRPARFFFGGKNTTEVAEELRDQQVALWRNVPVQGITVEDMEMGELYKVYDNESESEIVFAPLELIVLADSLEDMIRFALKEEFRRIGILEPKQLNLTAQEIERLFFRVSESISKGKIW